MIFKNAYRSQIEAAVEEFLDNTLADFPDQMEEKVEEANDELMLAVYEWTNDRRRA